MRSRPTIVDRVPDRVFSPMFNRFDLRWLSFADRRASVLQEVLPEASPLECPAEPRALPS